MAKYAGFWLRLIAFIIDGAMMALLGAGVAVLLFLMSFPDLLGRLVLFGLGWLYFAFMESSSHQGTVGKLAVGIKVTNEKGGAVSFGQASGRYFGKYISTAILLIGHLMIAFTPKKQALHDKFANTLVVRKY